MTRGKGDPDPHIAKTGTRVALVTGGHVRVGRATALELARAGFDIVLTYNRSKEPAERAVEEIERAGRRAAALQVELGDAEAAAMLPARAAEAMSRLDVVVNNASGFERTPVGGVTAEDWDRLFDVNARAPFLIAQGAVAYLKYDDPVIVNILDTATRRPWSGYIPYLASKAALEAVTIGLARALAPKVRVNGVAPGPIEPPADYTDAERKRAADATLLKRWGAPEDVARTVRFLVEERYLTGVVVPVDGGRRVA